MIIKRKTRVILIVFFIGICLISILLLRKQNPSPAKTSKFPTSPLLQIPTLPPSQLFTQPNNITLSLPASLKFPSKIPHLTITNALGNETEIAKSLGFDYPGKTVGNAIFWLKNDRSLALNTKDFTLSYAAPLPLEINLDSATEIQTFAQNQISKIFPDLKFQEPHLFFFTSKDEAESKLTDIKHANIVRATFFPQHKDLVIIANTTSIGPITATFIKPSRTLQIDSVYFTISEGQEINLIPLETAIDQIKNHQGIIVGLASPKDLGFSIESPTTPQNTTITSAKLGYYIPQGEKSALVPVYIFEGTTTIQNSKEIASITILIPASSK